MRMSTAQKILKLPKRERDQYVAVIENLYTKYKDNYGSGVLLPPEVSGVFSYHDIDFLQSDMSETVLDFLEVEQVLKKDTHRVGNDYETSVEEPTAMIFLDAFNALVSGLSLDAVPKHIQDLPAITFDTGKRVLACGKQNMQLRDRNSFAKVVLTGIFDSYPKPFVLTDEIILEYGLSENKQTLAGISNSINKRLKALTGISENPLTYANYVFTLRQGLTLQKIGNDPRDYN